jgi:hypothetical protein
MTGVVALTLVHTAISLVGIFSGLGGPRADSPPGVRGEPSIGTFPTHSMP